MNNLITIKILSGVPASGKTTWARNFIAQNPDTKRINRDDLRMMFDNSRNTDGNENYVNNIKLSLIKSSIDLGKNLILDDTHCYMDHLSKIIDYIRIYANDNHKNIKIELIDFQVDINDCIKRNKERDTNIKNSAIYHMNKSKSNIVISDLNIDNHIIIK